MLLLEFKLSHLQSCFDTHKILEILDSPTGKNWGLTAFVEVPEDPSPNFIQFQQMGRLTQSG